MQRRVQNWSSHQRWILKSISERIMRPVRFCKETTSVWMFRWWLINCLHLHTLGLSYEMVNRSQYWVYNYLNSRGSIRQRRYSNTIWLRCNRQRSTLKVDTQIFRIFLIDIVSPWWWGKEIQYLVNLKNLSATYLSIYHLRLWWCQFLAVMIHYPRHINYWRL